MHPAGRVTGKPKAFVEIAVAEVFLLKDGMPTDHRASRPHRFSVETVTDKLTPFEKRFHETPPDINPAHGPAVPADPYKHVVVHIDESEINGVFPEAGWYHVPEITAEDCTRLFGTAFP